VPTYKFTRDESILLMAIDYRLSRMLVTNRANLQVDSILKFPRVIATLRQSSGRTCVDLIVRVFRRSVINDQRFVSIRANDRRFMLGCCHRESLKTKTPPRNTLKQLDYPHVPPHTHTRARRRTQKMNPQWDKLELSEMTFASCYDNNRFCRAEVIRRIFADDLRTSSQ